MNELIKQVGYYDEYNFLEYEINKLQISQVNKQILIYIAQGYSIQDISLLLGLTPKTIKNKLYYLKRNKHLKQLLEV